MKKLKNSIPMLIILSLVTTAMISVSPVAANPTALSVLFPNGTSSSIGEYSQYGTFDVYVYITDVEILYGYDFWLKYDTAVLTATSITLGDFFPGNSPIWKNEIDEDAGYVRYLVCLIGVPRGEGVSGSGLLAIVTFTVDDLGATGLDLCDTKLSNGYAQLIPHEAYDGYFNTEYVVPEATLIEWKLKVNHAAGIGKGHKSPVGAENLLEAYVSNPGTIDVNVKASFLITDTADNLVAIVESDLVHVPVGTTARVSATWTASNVDVYLVTATLFYGPYPAQAEIEDGSSRTQILSVTPT